MTTVLVVDDHEDTRRLVAHFLEEAGLTVRLADGAAAARAALETEYIDVMVVDVSMGGESGIQLLMSLRQDERYRDLPAIVTTGTHALDDISFDHPGLFQAAFRKPSPLEELLASVRGLAAVRSDSTKPGAV